MIMLITLCYLGCVYLAFKVIKLKVTPVSIAVAALIGVFLLGGVVIGWKLSAPMTQQMFVNRPVVPLLASQNTKELIKKVHVKQGQPVKKGNVLYEVDATPFQYAVDQQAAQLAEAKQQIQTLEAAVAVAAAKVEHAKAALASAKADLDTDLGVQAGDAGAISKLKVDVQRLSYESAQAAVDVAVASRTSAEFALVSARNALQATEAQLRTAQLEFDRVYTRAPADGFIMNWQATEGTMTTTLMRSAQGTFQDMTKTLVFAIYRQNLLTNVAPGDAVEIAFKSLPNHIANGKVDAIESYTGEGQLLTQGVLPVAATLGSKGFLAVRIVLDDPAFAKELALGGAGTTAIYTQFGKPFHVITKIALRMKSWLYNLPI